MHCKHFLPFLSMMGRGTIQLNCNAEIKVSIRTFGDAITMPIFQTKVKVLFNSRTAVVSVVKLEPDLDSF